MIPQGRTRSVAAVFGGSGFIGRYAVKRLASRGYTVRVAVRDPEAALFLKPMGKVGQIVPLYASIANEATVQRAVEGADVVVNLVGILAEGKRGDFNRIHAEGAGLIAKHAAASQVARLVHISAIGADPSAKSYYAASKGRGEQAVREAFAGADIVRPSVVFGPEDQFFNRFGAIAQMMPVMPVVAGDARMQPVFVGDVADGIMAILDQTHGGSLFEFAGPQVWTFREILAYILKETRRNRRMINVPMSVARLQASLLEFLPTKPLTRDQLMLLSKDNVASGAAPGLPQLGIVPTPLELVVPAYLSRFRQGGGKRDVLPEELKGVKADLP